MGCPREHPLCFRAESPGFAGSGFPPLWPLGKEGSCGLRAVMGKGTGEHAAVGQVTGSLNMSLTQLDSSDGEQGAPLLES